MEIFPYPEHITCLRTVCTHVCDTRIPRSRWLVMSVQLHDLIFGSYRAIPAHVVGIKSQRVAHTPCIMIPHNCDCLSKALHLSHQGNASAVLSEMQERTRMSPTRLRDLRSRKRKRDPQSPLPFSPFPLSWKCKQGFSPTTKSTPSL